MPWKTFQRYTVLLILVGNTGTAFAQQIVGRHESRRRPFVETGGNYYYLPGSVLGLDGSIIKHPDKLTGHAEYVRPGYQLNPRWSVQLNLFRMHASGDGEWQERNTTTALAAKGVDGHATGRTTWHLNGFAFEIKRSFPHERFHPYVLGGAGFGKLRVEFDGEFNGVFKNISKEGRLPYIIREEVHEVRVANIPIFTIESGMDIRMNKWLSLSFAGFWNTGVGVKAGLQLQFDPRFPFPYKFKRKRPP